ncbi:MAG: DUF2510 domain-containing protein [Acidimicrobiales bacterium]
MTGTVNGAGFGVGIAFLIVFWFVAVIGSLVTLVIALVDIVKRPEWQWKLARQEKVLWLLLVILVNVLAIPALIYWFNVRKKLIAVERSAANGEFGPGHMTYSGWEPDFLPSPYSTMAPPGWFADEGGENQLRWWDGTRWTEHVWNAEPPNP